MTDLAKIAEHNLRTYLSGVPFRNESDREAALACVDVLVDSRAPSNAARDAAPDVVELSDVDVAAWVERNGLDGVLSKTDARAAFDDARAAHLMDHAGKGDGNG